MTSGEIVPIRLDIAVGQQRFQDTFCWSTAETQEGAENFAAALCRDNSLPQTIVPTIVSAIKQQIAAVGECSPATIDGPQTERNEIIRLDIGLGSQRLQDQLVWDVNSTEHDPDSFASVLCKDLSADKAFVPLVAWHIRQQVHEYRRTGPSSTPHSVLDPAATDKPQSATRRTRRKLSVKQPADTGFKSTYSSGVVRRPEEWRQWAAHVASTDAPPLLSPMPAASTAHSQGGISSGPLQKAHNATSPSHGSPQFPGRSTTALSGHSQHQPSGQTEPAWNQAYSQQQAQQAFWMQRQQQQQQQQQEQQQQYTAVFIQQAQAIWERMHMSTMGIKMPRTYDEAETVVKAVQQVQQTQQQGSNATSPSTQSRFGPKAVPSQFQDVSMSLRASSAGYGPGFTYSTSQGPQGQMNPLLMDYAGLQYPGY